MGQYEMKGARTHTIRLIAVVSILVSFIAGNWYLSRCTVLCDVGFWNAQPSADEVAAELHFFTDLSRSRATGLKLFVPFEASFTPLHWAVRKGDTEIVRLLIDAGAPANAMADQKLIPLLYAAGRRDPEITTLLLEAGADPNIETTTRDITALHRAARVGALETVSLLIEAGAEVNQEDERGWRPLRAALQHEDLNVAKLLIENGANVRDPGLLYVASNEGPPGAVRLLLEAGADPRLENRGGSYTGLHGFARNEDMAALEALLDAGAGINVQDFWRKTPLSTAIGNGNPAIIWRMIEAGAELSNPGDWSTALHSAVSIKQPNPKIIELAIARGADPNYRDRRGRTALHLVAGTEGTETAAVLVAAGADIEALDKNGDTPFLLAIQERNVPMAQAFIRLGADAEATGAARRGPLFYAAGRGGRDTLSWMLAQSSNVNPRDDDGNTPLMLAAGRTRILIELLLDAGADVNATNAFGQTPLHIAARTGNVECVRALIAGGADTRAIDSQGRTPKDLVSHLFLSSDQVTMDMLNQ